jgi:hypothetical protein
MVMCVPLVWEVSVGCTKWDSSHTYIPEIRKMYKVCVCVCLGEQVSQKPTGVELTFLWKTCPLYLIASPATIRISWSLQSMHLRLALTESQLYSCRFQGQQGVRWGTLQRWSKGTSLQDATRRGPQAAVWQPAALPSLRSQHRSSLHITAAFLLGHRRHRLYRDLSVWTRAVWQSNWRRVKLI